VTRVDIEDGGLLDGIDVGKDGIGPEMSVGEAGASAAGAGRSGEFAVVDEAVCPVCEGRGFRYVMSVVGLLMEGDDGWRRVGCSNCCGSAARRRRLAG
jgi:hypothetical protein